MVESEYVSKADHPSLLDQFDMEINSLAKAIEYLESRVSGILAPETTDRPEDISTPALRFASRLGDAVSRVYVQRQRIEQLSLRVDL